MARLAGSLRISYARWRAAKRASAAGFSAGSRCRSGCRSAARGGSVSQAVSAPLCGPSGGGSPASLRYAFWISSSEASLEVEGGVERVSLGGSLVHMLVVVAVASCSSVERWVVFPLVLTAVFESRLAEMRSARPVRHGSGKQVVSSSRWTVARTEASDLLARERASRRRVAAPL